MYLADNTSKVSSNNPISNVQDKINLEKQLPFKPNGKNGPTVELYFHELSSENTWGQKVFSFFLTPLVTVFFAVTLPSFSLMIKLFSSGPVFEKTKVPGRRGRTFTRYTYSTQYSNSEKNDFLFGTFLHKTGFAKLPSIINVWKGDMNLFGPQSYPSEWCNKWNREFSDYYKRFAVKPGFFKVADRVTDPNDLDQVSASLKRELRYVLKPSFKKDLRSLTGNSS
jgi:putative colanic acid biosynthesis UDP-glucose lipid carrier transferase